MQEYYNEIKKAIEEKEESNIIFSKKVSPIMVGEKLLQKYKIIFESARKQKSISGDVPNLNKVTVNQSNIVKNSSLFFFCKAKAQFSPKEKKIIQ